MKLRPRKILKHLRDAAAYIIAIFFTGIAINYATERAGLLWRASTVTESRAPASIPDPSALREPTNSSSKNKNTFSALPFLEEKLEQNARTDFYGGDQAGISDLNHESETVAESGPELNSWPELSTIFDSDFISQNQKSRALPASGNSKNSLTTSTATDLEETIDSSVSTSTTTATSTETVIQTATFSGWSHVKAVGAKTPAPQADDLSSEPASVTLSWWAFGVNTGSLSSYNLYRADSALGPYALIVSGISTSARSSADNTVSGGQTYYYKVTAQNTAGELIPPDTSDMVIKVIVPPENQVLLHRWAANQEMCTLMKKTPDRANHYRCAYTGPGSVLDGGVSYFDLEASLFLDRFEQGCNYTFSSTVNKCGSPNGCIGNAANPNTLVTGENGNIYYSRRNGRCFVNTSPVSGTTWVEATSTTATWRRTMGSSAPGLPPLVLIDQVEAQDVCTGQTLAGFAGTKRLPRRKEQFLAAAWSSTLSDANILTNEAGLDLPGTGVCNTAFGDSVVAYENNPFPSNKETLPGCLNTDCAASPGTIRSVRTGGTSTRYCTSRYGAQDMIGNVWEWVSDQMNCTANANTTCFGVPAASNTSDSTNSDFTGLLMDATYGSTTTNSFETWPKIQFPFALPIVSAGVNADGVVAMPSASALQGDRFYIVLGNTRGTYTGGGWNTGNFAGRFTVNMNNAVTFSTNNNLGLRCVLRAE